MALPRTLYVADVWSCTSKRKIKGQKGMAKVIKQLATTQRAGALAITGGLRTSPTDALDATTHLLPAELTLDNWVHKATVRMLMLLPGHPLFKTVTNKTTCKSKRHKSPLNFLMAKYGYDTKHIEKIPATARNPADRGKLPFKISITEDREESIREAENAQEEVQVYADGSAVNGKVGTAAILLHIGKPPHVLHTHLGPESEHTVHEAELVGILQRLELIKTEKRANKACMLGVDNQAAIKAFKSNLRSPGHHLAREALRIAEQIQKRKKKTKYALMIRWTAGHKGIEGNEAVDMEAKKAAEGLSSEKHLLSTYLRKPLLSNPAAIKRMYHDMLKNRWIESWRELPRERKMH
jgi:ribonuclease HI